MVSFKKGNGCPVACEQGRASSPIMAGRSVSFPMWLSRDFSQLSCPANVRTRCISADPFPFPGFEGQTVPDKFPSTRPPFLFILAAIAMQSRQMDENKNTFRAFYLFVQDEDHPQLMKLRHLRGHLKGRAHDFLKSSTWLSGFRKFCRQLGPTAMEWYNGLDCTRKTAERDRSRVTKVVYQTFWKKNINCISLAFFPGQFGGRPNTRGPFLESPGNFSCPK